MSITTSAMTERDLLAAVSSAQWRVPAVRVLVSIRTTETQRERDRRKQLSKQTRNVTVTIFRICRRFRCASSAVSCAFFGHVFAERDVQTNTNKKNKAKCASYLPVKVCTKRMICVTQQERNKTKVQRDTHNNWEPRRFTPVHHTVTDAQQCLRYLRLRSRTIKTNANEIRNQTPNDSEQMKIRNW